jgi:hypothetical protein
LLHHVKRFARGFADDVNLLGDNIDAIKENMVTLIDASKEVEHREN